MRTILFVDDSKNIREFCKSELEQEGYRVLLAHDGKEALHILRQEPADLVILDVRMPRMSGLEAIQHIIAQDPNIPIIFYTAYHEDYARDNSGWSAEACVQKSENLKELKLAVGRVLNRQQRQLSECGAADGHGSCGLAENVDDRNQRGQ